MPDDPRYVLGVAAFEAGAGAALLVDGEPLCATTEERFTRVRHDASFPRRAVRECLAAASIGAERLDAVAFHGKPLRQFERVLATQLGGFPRSARSFSSELFTWLGDRLWTRNRLIAELGAAPDRLYFVASHRALASAAFLPSPFEEAGILILDGAGEWASTSLGRGRGREVELTAELRFPHSLGMLCAAFTQFLGWDPLADEHKLFELAAHGEPRFVDEVGQLCRSGDDGRYELSLEHFSFQYDAKSTFTPKLEELLGPRRVPGEPLCAGGDERRHADLAASLQVVLERTALGLVRRLHELHPHGALCLGGSLARNARLNAHLLEHGPFERLFVQPAQSAAAGALGAALSVDADLLGGEQRRPLTSPALGEALFDDAEGSPAEAPGDERGGAGRPVADPLELRRDVVAHLAAGRLVGLARGRAEWGARSLGRRTLLADPRADGVRERINRELKHREAFRPFAPLVRAERANELFELDNGLAGVDWGPGAPTRLKLAAVLARERMRDAWPAAVEADGRACPQVVDAQTDPELHALLEDFERATGCPVLLSAALNLRGDPTVRSVQQALMLFERSGIDALVIENRIYERE